MKITQQDLNDLKNKYGGTFKIITEKPIEHAAKFRLEKNTPPSLLEPEIIILEEEDSVVVQLLAAHEGFDGKYGVSYGVSKEKPISCLFKAIYLGFDDVLKMYEEKK